MSTKGTLYLIPNTLGEENREQQLEFVLPKEVIKKAASLEYWIVENAKTTRAFLKAISLVHPLNKPIQELKMSEWRGAKSDSDPRQLIAPLLEGQDVGLISEAGLPAIADPGAEIVQAAHRANITVAPLVGPSSLMLALMASGMNGQRFMFHGYLPIKEPQRSQTLKSLEAESRKSNQTQLWIETPYRNQAMLEEVLRLLDKRTSLCLAIDMSLPTQTVVSMTVAEWQNWSKQQGTTALQSLDRRPAVFLLLAH